MSLTRANVEALLISRVGLLFVEIGKDGSTVDGSNADLNDSIGYAVRQCGQIVDSATAVDNDDVARVSDIDKLLDIAELKALETAYTAALTLVSISLGEREQRFSDIAKGLKDLIEMRREHNRESYGIGERSLQGGVFDHAFQETNDGSIIY